MAAEAVIELARRYLLLLRKHGFHLDRAVLFGSYARGEAQTDSDIDLLLPSVDFETLTWKQEELLWSLTAQVDSRIEPIPCTERQWWGDQVSPLIEIARQEGIIIEVDSALTYPARQEFQRSQP
jgi:predicted nucleotidyltransferase